MSRPAPVSTVNTKSECRDDTGPLVKVMKPTATEHESSQQGKNSCEPGLPADTGDGLCLHSARAQTWNCTNKQRPHIWYYSHPYEYSDKTPNMCIERLRPTIEWPRIWKNLWTAPVTNSMKKTWYKIIHGIFPKTERLHKIRIAPTENFRLCDRKETLLHRLAECGDGRYQ